MDILKRSLAPILSEAWAAIDDEARRVLKLNLTGRKLVDFSGPHGLLHAAVNTGRLTPLTEPPSAGVAAGLRVVQPLVEMRVPFQLDLADLDSMARGARNPNLEPVVKAAERMAHAEDAAIFNGYAQAGIAGIIPSSPHAPRVIAGPADYARAIVEAKETLRQAGIDGPYALALGSRAYEDVFAATEEGYPLAKRIERQLIEGPIMHAPAIQGGVVLSTRGGDYELTVGQDLAIGYAFHGRQAVELYLIESFTFRVLEPAAAVYLKQA